MVCEQAKSVVSEVLTVNCLIVSLPVLFTDITTKLLIDNSFGISSS